MNSARAAGLLATTPGLSICVAALPSLGGIYPEQSNALDLNFDGVAVDDPSPAGHFGLGKVGREYQRNGEKDQRS